MHLILSMASWMLARLKRATRDHDGAADTDRMSLLTIPVTRASYLGFLQRIYGFELPIEVAFARTDGLADAIDLRSRTDVRLLKVDLAGLGVANPSGIEVCRAVQPFRTCCEALGWMYVIDRNLLLNGVVQRHLAGALPHHLATSYLAAGGRAVGSRLDELGAALDGVAQTAELADQIIEAARAAFGHQRAWFHQPTSPRVQDAPTRAA